MAQWLSGRALDLWSLGRGFDSHRGLSCVATLGKCFTPTHLSPSSITWYRSKNDDVLRLGRWSQAWRIVMAAYRWGWLKKSSPAVACTPGWAPGPRLGNEYGRTLPFLFTDNRARRMHTVDSHCEVSISNISDNIASSRNHWVVNVCRFCQFWQHNECTGSYSVYEWLPDRHEAVKSSAEETKRRQSSLLTCQVSRLISITGNLHCDVYHLSMTVILTQSTYIKNRHELHNRIIIKILCFAIVDAL